MLLAALAYYDRAVELSLLSSLAFDDLYYLSPLLLTSESLAEFMLVAIFY